MANRCLRGLLAAAVVVAAAGTGVASLIWSLETPDIWNGQGRENSLALDSLGRPHIAYYGGYSDLIYVRWDGSSWVRQPVDGYPPDGTDINCGTGTSIAVDALDRPRISYVDSTNNDLKYAAWNGSAWSRETVDSVSQVIGATSLGLDPTTGYARIAYFDFGSGQRLLYASYDGASWSTTQLAVVATANAYPSLVIDPDGCAHVCYYSESGGRQVRYAKNTGGSWTHGTVEGSLGIRSGYVSMALDSERHPHLTYLNYGLGLRYAQWTGTAWSIATITNPSGIDYSSIDLDSHDYPRIAYRAYGTGDQDLYYTAWDGSNWQTEAVDTTSPGRVYDGCLRVDQWDYPKISYAEDDGGSTPFWLRYAAGHSPLAVTFTGLDARVEGGQVVVEFGWAGGRDAVAFEVRRVASRAAGSEVVGRIAPAPGREHYRVVDPSGRPGMVYEVRVVESDSGREPWQRVTAH